MGNPPREMSLPSLNQKKKCRIGSRGTTNGTGVSTYKIHLLNKEIRPYIGYLDYRLWWWVSHLYTLNVRFHSNKTTTNTEPNTSEVSIYLYMYIWYGYSYIYHYIQYISILYIYINIYLHFSQCFDFIILYMLWICSRTRTHDSSSRKAILIWLSSSSWFHGSMVLGCFPRDSCEFHVLEPTVLVSLSAAMHPRKGKLKVTF